MKWLMMCALVSGCASDPAPVPVQHDEWDDKLAERVVDYNAALRIAALRLTGELPTLTELERVQNAPDPREAYLEQIHAYLASDKFAQQIRLYWQDTMKLDGAGPAFVAQLTVADRSYLDAFTAPGNVLEDQQMNARFFSNFGFRRVRWLQEVFECSKFPAELSPTPIDVGGATPYTGTFPFDSIATPFLATNSVLCANCHSNLNHIAPVFAHYDKDGNYQPDIAVPTPAPGSPLAQLTDYLPPGEPLAWRHGVPITDMHSLGAAVAADPGTASCAIARMWNWAMGKRDIVDADEKVPTDTIAEQVAAFSADGYRVRNALYRIFTSDDFVRF
jgi:hypothetical protein